MKHLTKFKLMLSRAEVIYKYKKRTKNIICHRRFSICEETFNFKLLRQDVDQYIQSNEEYIKQNKK